MEKEAYKRHGMSFRNLFFYIAGMIFLGRAKIKSILKGYPAPKSFGISEGDRCIQYDFHVVDRWLDYLMKYTNNGYSLTGKTILELGPGSDFGTGIYMLSRGCSQYNAIDVFNLMKKTPKSFYELLLNRLQSKNVMTDIGFLKQQVEDALAGNASRINCVVRDDFDILKAFGLSNIDLVVSQAAFQAFDDIEKTVSQLSAVCRGGAVFIAEIDLRTLSRWIRDKDPNNIYRYSANIYKWFRFRGIANRIRPFQYKEALERNGWTDVSIIPTSRIEDDMAKIYSGLHKTFVSDEKQMDYLSIMLCARKGPAR